MHDFAPDAAGAFAEDLMQVLCAYELELEALASNLPGVEALRAAIGVALAEAGQCVLKRDAGGPIGETRH